MLAIEKDPHMATLVSERFSETGQLKVLQEDFVKCHIHPHMSSLLGSIEPSSANSRYAKEETAFRLVESSLWTSEYRPINVFVNFYSDPEFKFKVPRTSFFPQPNVNSAFNGKCKMFRCCMLMHFPCSGNCWSTYDGTAYRYVAKDSISSRLLESVLPTLFF